MKRSKKILIYKICCVAFGAILLFVPQRGTPYADIRVLATVLGVDGTDGNVTVSAQLAVPVAQGSDGKASTVAKATGGSIGEALENLEIGLGRRIDFGHLSTVAIGQDVLLQDLRLFTGYLMSSGKAGPGTYLVHCPQSTAADFLNGAQDMGESSDAELDSFIAFSKNGNHVSTTTLLRFLQALNSTSHATYLPCVALENESAQNSGVTGAGEGNGMKNEQRQEINDRQQEQSAEKEGQENKQQGNKQQDKQVQNEKQEEGKQQEKGSSGGQSKGGEKGGQSQNDQKQSGGQSGGQDGHQKKRLVAANQVAVYGGETPEALVLDPMVTRGVVWQDKHSDFGLVELRNMQMNGTDIASVSARLMGKKVRVSADVKNGENVLNYTIKLKLRLDDSQICGNPLFYTQWKNALEKAYESEVRENVLRTVQACKEHNVDFLGFREYFHKFSKKRFKSFDLSTLVVHVHVKADIIT